MASLRLFQDAAPGDLLHIITNMREADRAEVHALRWHDPDTGEHDDVRFAAEMGAVPGFSWVAYADDGEPVAVVGAHPVWPRVWTVFSFGTDRWKEVAILLTRHVRRHMIPGLVNAGAHLAFCFVADANAAARGWLGRMGAREEHPLRQWGQNREDFIFCAWRN